VTTNLTGRTVRWTEAYISLYTSGCPNPELTRWYEKLRGQRFVVVYDDGGEVVAVKGGGRVYALPRAHLEAEG
jgi:hypothetical protein